MGMLNSFWHHWYEGARITSRLNIVLEDDDMWGDEIYTICGKEDYLSALGTREDMVRLGMMIIENLMTDDEYEDFFYHGEVKNVIKES